MTGVGVAGRRGLAFGDLVPDDPRDLLFTEQQASELSELEDRLPDHGRRHGPFTRLEALDSHAGSKVASASATSSGWNNTKGLAVT